MRLWIASALLALMAACSGETESVTIANAQYRPPLVDGGTGVAYFSITSKIADRITAVSSPRAKAVEIHESTAAGGMAGMQRRESVALAIGKTVEFAPGGYHLMVIQPEPLGANATFPIQITLESGRVETVPFAGPPPS